jgi:D-tyrosyl-tRNA(Tyr) deacylase
LWESNQKGFDLSVKDIKGDLLVVSQFTLFGDCNKGTKPNFANSASYNFAKENYDKFIEKLEESRLRVQCGEFGAMMRVQSENNGPVTILLEK